MVGFDDIETAQLTNPSLTTVRQPAYEMGKKSSEMLINILNNKSMNTEKVITFKPQLIVRNSTKSI